MEKYWVVGKRVPPIDGRQKKIPQKKELKRTQEKDGAIGEKTKKLKKLKGRDKQI